MKFESRLINGGKLHLSENHRLLLLKSSLIFDLDELFKLWQEDEYEESSSYYEVLKKIPLSVHACRVLVLRNEFDNYLKKTDINTYSEKFCKWNNIKAQINIIEEICSTTGSNLAIYCYQNTFHKEIIQWKLVASLKL